MKNLGGGEAGGRSGRLFGLIGVCVVFLLFWLVAEAIPSSATHPDEREPFSSLRPLPSLDPRAVELGSLLFSDTILSAGQDRSCVTCHNLATGGTVHSSTPAGKRGKVYRFNTPTIFNAGSNYRLGWLGEYTSLEKQNEKILLDEYLMGATWPMLTARLGDSKFYSGLFEQIYGSAPNRANILEALSSFQHSLATPNSAFDRYLNGDITALTGLEYDGYKLFKDYGCASCHQGANVGGNMFQKFGIFGYSPDSLQKDEDLGRFTVTGKESDIKVYRVPSLRNVEVTSPYLHDGSVSTLSKTVEIMGASQLGRKLIPSEVDALVAFLNTLTGEYNGNKLQAPSAKHD